MQFGTLSDKIFRVFAPCPISALLFWAMFFLVITYGPTDPVPVYGLPGLQALHAV